ncbi:MAG: RNA polymerase sigma factor [Saprospiraceae bacterium]|nr:RNA polymerase sigma factor [Saprospiraceae bacterium]MBK6565383.1 RNA polymerase sigma factor [Saprospiraceae bacterium]MBK6784138.1 RNA polymerase sigma factor [Saprospiraceae bacterium]MBK7522653.1 RNA polymerase sigma factor [Saprospiraceae bacterium]MBK8080036.1 RNA polymerase sigma factor [Saprospiraceae bacterium]
MEDSSIISGCKRGRESAYKALVEKYSPALLAVCIRYMIDKEHAKDVLQDSLIKIIRNIDQFEEKGSLRNWLITIVVNTCLKEIKKYRHLEDIDSVLNEENREMSAIDDLHVKDLLNVLNQLPDMQRIIFNLHAVEGYSHAEIATLMNIAESSSRVYLTRARQFLQLKTKSFEHQK